MWTLFYKPENFLLEDPTIIAANFSLSGLGLFLVVEQDHFSKTIVSIASALVGLCLPGALCALMLSLVS